MAKCIEKSFMCLALISATSAFAQGATVGYWEFDEKVPGQQAGGTAGEILDSSTNAHQGTAVGVPLPSYVEGWTGSSSAIHLTAKSSNNDPDEDRVVIPHSADFNLMLADLQDYTIEAIIKNPSGAFVSHMDTTGPGWSMSTGAADETVFYIEGTGLNFTHPRPGSNTHRCQCRPSPLLGDVLSGSC